MKKLMALLITTAILLVQISSQATTVLDGVVFSEIHTVVDERLSELGYGDVGDEITGYRFCCYDYKLEELTIPQEINGCPVVYMESIVSKSLKVLNLPKTVNQFGIDGNISSANCPNLEKINIYGDGYIKLTSGFFNENENLKYFTADKKNTVREDWYIGDFVFSNTGVEKIILDRSLDDQWYSVISSKHMCTGVFMGCKKLRVAYITPKCKIIGDRSFASCKSIDYVYLTDSINEIRDTAFRGCTALRTVWLPAKEVTISASAFDNCSKMTLIADKNTMIKSGAVTMPVEQYAQEHKLAFIPAIVRHGEPSTVVAKADQTATVTINGIDIPAYTVNGSVYVGESALKSLGFTMDWDGDARTTTVTAPENVNWSVELNTNPNPYSINVVSSDVEFWYNDFRIPALNVGGGESIIDVNALAEAVLY